MREKFPEDEKTYYDENKKLLDEWKAYIKDKKIVHKYGINGFVDDGFYPYYYLQEIKILYLAIESRGISGGNYIDIVNFKDDKIGKQHINSNGFFRKLLKITYGIKNNFMEWDKIPDASEIKNNFGRKDGISFAIMELSKFSNDNLSPDKNKKQIKKFISISKNETRNFWNEQIKILNPDYIISMNLRGNLNVLGKITSTENQRNKKHSRVHSLCIGNGKSVKIIDTYHFRYSVEDKWFYNSIVELIKNDNP